MKKEIKILAADHDSVKVDDNVLVDVETKTLKNVKKQLLGQATMAINHLNLQDDFKHLKNVVTHVWIG
ncbi:MAG: hypothetical protein LBP70_02850 [Mycoplasmataceae bacterium]|jgi:hypothetical protein|nr:hypothetical protein [Mycoplasmataceae bacterium]